MKKPFVLHTEQLSLRPCQMSDLEALHQLWTDADIRRFLFDDRSISREEARSFIAASTVSFSQFGYGLWLVFEPHSDWFAGFSGLLQTPAAAPREAPSLLFGTHPRCWGRGYAKAAAAAVLAHAFEGIGLKTVVADVDELNVASIRVLEALGMRQSRRAIVDERPLLYYEIRR